MKSKVTKIIPDGATLARADGSAVNVGDEVSMWEALTLTLPAGSSGGSVQFAGGLTGHAIAERIGGGVPLGAVATAPTPIALATLAVGDTANPSRARRPMSNLPALKIE